MWNPSNALSVGEASRPCSALTPCLLPMLHGSLAPLPCSSYDACDALDFMSMEKFQVTTGSRQYILGGAFFYC